LYKSSRQKKKSKYKNLIGFRRDYFCYRKNAYHFSLGENPQFDIGETSDLAPQKQYMSMPSS